MKRAMFFFGVIILVCFASFVYAAEPISVTIEVYENYGNCVKMSNSDVELFVTKDFGPRVICYRMVGGKSLFAHCNENTFIESELGKWWHYGGHRLWMCPEVVPAVYAPDNEKVKHTKIGTNTVQFTPLVNAVGMVKEMFITLDSEGSGVTISHKITNNSLLPIEIAAWAITILKPGGQSIIPQEPFVEQSKSVQPVRPLVLWSYTDLTDYRYKIGRKYFRLECDPQATDPQKYGAEVKAGWCAYALNDQLFLKRFEYDKNATYPDCGAMVEIFSCAAFLELETLGKLEKLAPGESTIHVEKWSLYDNLTVGDTEDSISAVLAPIIK